MLVIARGYTARHWPATNDRAPAGCWAPQPTLPLGWCWDPRQWVEAHGTSSEPRKLAMLKKTVRNRQVLSSILIHIHSHPQPSTASLPCPRPAPLQLRGGWQLHYVWSHGSRRPHEADVLLWLTRGDCCRAVHRRLRAQSDNDRATSLSHCKPIYIYNPSNAGV